MKNNTYERRKDSNGKYHHGLNKKHSPSEHREITRKIKKGSYNIEELIAEAEKIKDPYYSALSLQDIAVKGHIDEKLRAELTDRALNLINDVNVEWRKAEIIGKISKKIKKLDSLDDAFKKRTLARIAEIIVSMPDGNGLMDAIVSSVRFMNEEEIRKLLDRSVGNRGFEKKSVKEVIKAWCSNFEIGIAEANYIFGKIKILCDRNMNIHADPKNYRLIGYLYLMLKRSGQPEDIVKIIFEKILSVIKNIPSENDKDTESVDDGKNAGIEFVSYVINTLDSREEVLSVKKAVENFGMYEKARILSTLGGRADKLKMKKEALEFFMKGAELLRNVSESERVAKTAKNISAGIKRMGKNELAEEIYNEFCPDEKHVDMNENANNDNNGKSVSNYPKNDDPGFVNYDSTRHVLGIYDTYEGGIKSIHIRTVARAAPLCYAFGIDLALFGFPVDDINAFIERAILETNTGEGGSILRKMMDSHRIHLVKCTVKTPPDDDVWKDIGLPIATTSHPDNDKKISLKDAVKKTDGNGNICVIMGLGKKGLPKSLLKYVPYHLELTGKNVPLETCTAMGVIAHSMNNVQCAER